MMNPKPYWWKSKMTVTRRFQMPLQSLKFKFQSLSLISQIVILGKIKASRKEKTVFNLRYLQARASRVHSRNQRNPGRL